MLRSAVVLLSFVTPTLVSAAFSDVPSYHHYKDAITYVSEEGIASGYPDGTFHPDDSINRAEFTKLIVETFLQEQFQADQSTEALFTDTPTRSWYSPYLAVGTSAKLIQGYPDRSFRPGNPVTFAEAAKIISRIADPGLEPGNPWYEPFVRQLEDQKAIPPTIVQFDQPLLRGEVAEILWRLKEGITSQPSQSFNDIRTGKLGIVHSVPKDYFVISSATNAQKDYQGFVVIPQAEYEAWKQQTVKVLKQHFIGSVEAFISNSFTEPLDEEDQQEFVALQKLSSTLQEKWNVKPVLQKEELRDFPEYEVFMELLALAVKTEGQMSHAQIEQVIPQATIETKAEEFIDEMIRSPYPVMGTREPMEGYHFPINGIHYSVIVNGVAFGPYDSVQDLIFGSHSASAFAASSGDKQFVVLDGKVKGSYNYMTSLPDSLWPFDTFSPLPSGKTFAYSAIGQGRVFLLINGEELFSYEDSSEGVKNFRSSGLVFAGDDRPAYVLREKGKVVVMIGDERGEPFDAINSQLEFHDDKLIYLAQKGEKELLMNGRTLVTEWEKPADQEDHCCSLESVAFSPDGTKAASAYHTEEPWGYRVIVNNQKGPLHAGDIGDITFKTNDKVWYLVRQIGYARHCHQSIRPVEWDFVRDTISEGEPVCAHGFEEYPQE